MSDRRQIAIEYIRQKVGSSTVLLLASGGVDSTVCAALLNEALPKKQVISLHIDNGFMRKNVLITLTIPPPLT
jgi:GMP synthase (glutamine-hydrolysing)